MVIINPIFMSKLSKIFPEISDQKIEILTFFVYGMSTKDIAYYKGVSVQAIPKTRVPLLLQRKVAPPPPEELSGILSRIYHRIFLRA